MFQFLPLCLRRFMPTTPNPFTPNTHYTENKSSLYTECSLYRIRYNEHKRWSLHRKRNSLYTECSLDRNIVFRYNGIRFTGMIFRFNGMDFGIMPININTHFSYMFVCVGRGERGCGISLHAADFGQTRKTLVNDSFLRSMKVTMKLILRKDLCALRDYSRMGFHRSKNGCLC